MFVQQDGRSRGIVSSQQAFSFGGPRHPAHDNMPCFASQDELGSGDVGLAHPATYLGS
jgi:hypothetical protein